MLKYVKALVQRNELTVLEVIVPEWELPILRALHEQGVTVLGDELVNREAPAANDEFERLSQRYKSMTNDDGSQGIPFFAAVYGQFGVGTENLRKAIAGATVEVPAQPDLIGEPAFAQNSSV